MTCNYRIFIYRKESLWDAIRISLSLFLKKWNKLLIYFQKWVDLWKKVITSEEDDFEGDTIAIASDYLFLKI